MTTENKLAILDDIIHSEMDPSWAQMIYVLTGINYVQVLLESFAPEIKPRNIQDLMEARFNLVQSLDSGSLTRRAEKLILVELVLAGYMAPTNDTVEAYNLGDYVTSLAEELGQKRLSLNEMESHILDNFGKMFGFSEENMQRLRSMSRGFLDFLREPLDDEELDEARKFLASIIQMNPNAAIYSIESFRLSPNDTMLTA